MWQDNCSRPLGAVPGRPPDWNIAGRRCMGGAREFVLLAIAIAPTPRVLAMGREAPRLATSARLLRLAGSSTPALLVARAQLFASEWVVGRGCRTSSCGPSWAPKSSPSTSNCSHSASSSGAGCALSLRDFRASVLHGDPVVDEWRLAGLMTSCGLVSSRISASTLSICTRGSETTTSS